MCHLDAMVDRVTTREALDKFLKLLVATPKTGAIQNRIFSKGFPNLDSDLDWRPIMEEVLYERDLSTFETDYPECTLALKSLGLYDRLGNREADTLTKCLINRILDEHDCPTLGESDVVNQEQNGSVFGTVDAKHLEGPFTQDVATFGGCDQSCRISQWKMVTWTVKSIIVWRSMAKVH